MSWQRFVSSSLLVLLLVSNTVLSAMLIRTTKEAAIEQSSPVKYDFKTYSLATIRINQSSLESFLFDIGYSNLLSSEYVCMLIPPGVCNVCLREQTDLFLDYLHQSGERGVVISPQYLYRDNRAVFSGINNVETISYSEPAKLFENNPYDGVCFLTIGEGRVGNHYLSTKGFSDLTELFFESINAQ